MRYAIVSQELTAPLEEIRLRRDQTGVALLLRREDRPVGFVMQELAPETTLSPRDVDRLTIRSAAFEILSDSLRRELHPPVSRPRPPTLTVAVCTRARESLLEACLRSVTELRSGPDTMSFEILVVDNAPPDDGTYRVAQSLDGVSYVREARPGLDFARNRALAESDTDFVAFLDDDVEVDRRWLMGFMEATAENPDADALTGLVLPYELESDAQIRFESRGGFRRGFAKRRYRGRVLPGNPLYPAGSGMFGAGCNMVLRRQAALDIGGFDEALDTGPPLPGGGDLDIFFRVVRAGGALVYEPQMLVFHKHRREHRQLRRQYWTWGTGLMAYVGKTYAADPGQRSQLRDLRRWWVMNELRLLKQSLTKPEETSPDLALAELVGGFVGVAGTYSRSVRRTERITREHA